jgi:hypothetical protein
MITNTLPKQEGLDVERDDRLILITRLFFTPLAAFTAIFGPLLVLFPGATEVFWSWQIRPEMSAVWVGAAYTFGAMAITTMLVVGRWSSSIVAIVGTWPFSIVMLAATLLHLDRFFLGTVQFYIWLIIYLALPFGLPVIFWLNRRRDPGVQPTDMLLPQWLRAVLGVAGAIVGLFGLYLFFDPTGAAGFWPWALTPLMSRVIGGWLLFLGTGALCALFERRYIAYRYFLPSSILWFTILLAASLFHLDNFDFGRLSASIYFIAVGAVILLLALMFLYLERRYQEHVLSALAVAEPA